MFKLADEGGKARQTLSQVLSFQVGKPPGRQGKKNKTAAQ
jgi:hypothetical protein